jgi:hypothetical protein
MYKLVLQIRQILLRHGFYFPDCDTLRCDGCDIPMVAQLLRELPTLGILCLLRDCHKFDVHFPRLWQIVQWKCSHWHVAAVTMRYANELEAES